LLHAGLTAGHVLLICETKKHVPVVGRNEGKPKHCTTCIIKNCGYLAKTDSHFCFECKKYPCTRLKNLDKRYRTNYQISLIENLNQIKSIGLSKYLADEVLKWTCKHCGKTICVHRDTCIFCKEK
jgi:hypothetical protein